MKLFDNKVEKQWKGFVFDHLPFFQNFKLVTMKVQLQ